MTIYQNKSRLEVVGITAEGYLVQNEGEPSDQWVIDPETFDKTYEEVGSTNTVTKEQVEDILQQSKQWVETIWDKTTMVAVRLPNGFVIVESSSCVDPANYKPEVGKAICLERIKNKIWELEGYKLQDKSYKG